MINVLEEHAERHWFVFMASSTDEISKLPTTTTAGQDELNTIKKACGDSFCLVTTETLPCYVLNEDDDEWVLVE